jgi:hypothetical protein
MPWLAGTREQVGMSEGASVRKARPAQGIGIFEDSGPTPKPLNLHYNPNEPELKFAMGC